MTLLEAAKELDFIAGDATSTDSEEAEAHCILRAAITETEQQQEDCAHVYGVGGYYDVAISEQGGNRIYWSGPENFGATDARFSYCPKCGKELGK